MQGMQGSFHDMPDSEYSAYHSRILRPTDRNHRWQRPHSRWRAYSVSSNRFWFPSRRTRLRHEDKPR